VVVSRLLDGMDCGRLTMLHVAPESCFGSIFAERFGGYETADVRGGRGVAHQVDLQGLPFEDGSYDFVFASHVLEHVPDDARALSEIRRILRPGGIAILPVPVLAEKTVDYPEPNPHEAFHVRAPGFDYFDRYERYFSRVERISSASLPGEYQPFVYEDRTRWPTKECPLRPTMQGERHVEIVPVCYR
jgi:SAM-dependent methyltransferase